MLDKKTMDFAGLKGQDEKLTWFHNKRVFEDF